MRDTLADTSEAARILGWHPRVSVEDGVKQLLQAESGF
jgi:nucleoside-diphosphate-sugar epimerase